MTLYQAPEGSNVTIVKVNGEEHNRRHLECLGITSGEKVQVVDSHMGAVIIKVKGYRLALDHDTAADIEVERPVGVTANA